MTNSPIQIAVAYLPIAKDAVIIGAAIVGVYVAIKGLGAWRQQLTGRSDYELSRRILGTLFRYRDAIAGARHPAMWAAEMPAPPEPELGNMSQDELRFYGVSKAYQSRWDKVSEQRTNLYADLLEAEAIWGDELKNIFQRAFDLEHELFTNIRHHVELMNPKTPEATKNAIQKIRKKRRDIMYGEISDDDEFKEDLTKVISEIEGYLKPKLSR